MAGWLRKTSWGGTPGPAWMEHPPQDSGSAPVLWVGDGFSDSAQTLEVGGKDAELGNPLSGLSFLDTRRWGPPILLPEAE